MTLTKAIEQQIIAVLNRDFKEIEPNAFKVKTVIDTARFMFDDELWFDATVTAGIKTFFVEGSFSLKRFELLGYVYELDEGII